MLDHEQRIAALEKDAATMKRDIIYKLEDTNSAVTIIRGIVGNQGQDIREIRNQVKIVNVHLDGIDTRLDGLKEEIRAIKDQQDGQGQDIKDIKRHLDALDGKQDGQGQDIKDIKRHLDALDGKFEQVLQLLTTLNDKAE